MPRHTHLEGPMQDTKEASYTDHSIRLQTATWKSLIRPIDPYKLHLKSLNPGFMLEIGCGIGRNLSFVKGNGVGVDHNLSSIDHCQKLGFKAFAVDEFKSSKYAKNSTFDSILMSHLLEDMDHVTRVELLSTYMPYLKPNGKVIMITPQERGQASDPTHVELVGFEEQAALALAFGLKLIKSYSFPFMRFMGPYFIYNEFVSVWLRES